MPHGTAFFMPACINAGLFIFHSEAWRNNERRKVQPVQVQALLPPLKDNNTMKLQLTKPSVALILKLLSDRENSLREQGADDNQTGKLRLLQKKITRQIQKDDESKRRRKATHQRPPCRDTEGTAEGRDSVQSQSGLPD